MTRHFAGCFIAIALLVSSNDAWSKTPRNDRALASCSTFTSHEEIGAWFADLEEIYPDIARASSIGTSVRGLELWNLVLSTQPDIKAAEPRIRIVGGIHGDECMGVEIVISIIEWLTNGYGEDDFISDLLDRAQFVLIPLINPDGYTGEFATRTNANGIDLNRNFGFAWVNEGDAPFTEPETRAIQRFSQQTSFTVGLSYHTVDNYVNAPWNYTPFHPPDEDLLYAMGEAYAGSSGYRPVFGWDWYAIFGDLNDWSLGTRGTFDWTIELRNDHDMEWSVHVDGLLGFLSFLFTGVKGVVKDSVTFEPLEARILVESIDTPIFTDPDVGDFHRILLPGTYSLTAFVPGYKAETVRNVTVPDKGVVTIDFSLEPQPRNSVAYAFAVNRMTLPFEIGAKYRRTDYLNDTMAWEALGPPDGWFYSLSPGGSITLDMGKGVSIEDTNGPDLVLVSGTGSDDPVTVFVAENQNGPFIQVENGSGDLYVDIEPSKLDAVRFVRVVDQGNGLFNDVYPGYDLDAVVNIAYAPYVPPESGIGDGDRDAGYSTEENWEAVSACDCQAIGRGAGVETEMDLLSLFIWTWV